MGMFDFFKKKKTQSELMVEASKKFLMNNESDNTLKDHSKEDIMSKLKNIDPSSLDPRKFYDLDNINTTTTQHPENDYTTPPLNHEDINTNITKNEAFFTSNSKDIPPPLMPQKNIQEKIEKELYPQQNILPRENKGNLDDLFYELKTIKTQNDLIIDMLRQIQRKLGM